MDNHKFFITIILTTYNRAHLITETLDSIKAQTYVNWRCIIIDDNSKDNTNDVIEEYLKKDERFEYHVKGNKYVKGLSASRNMGMNLIKETDFVQFFDDDDLMHPQKLEIQVNEFKKYQNLDLTVFPTVNFKNGDEVKIEWVKKNVLSNLIKNIGEDFILGKRIFTAQVPLIKWNYIKDIRFNEKLFYAEEWEVFCELFFTKVTKASYVNIPLYFHRKHEKSITSNLYEDDSINETSNNYAFLNVYKIVKQSHLFNGRVFTRFITFAINNKVNNKLLIEIKKDLEKGLLSHRIKDLIVLKLLSLTKLNKKIITKIIHRIVRC